MHYSNPKRPLRIVPQRPAPNPRPPLTFMLLYTVALLILTGGGSILGYNWAKYRTLQASAFALPWSNSPAGSNNPSQAGSLPNVENADSSALPDHLPVLDVLLLGVDERPQERNGFNTDTLILATLNPQNQQAGMLSFARDLWIPVPGSDESAKINTIYEIGERKGVEGGGAQLTMDMISRLTGRPVQYYVRINFSGFITIVDLIDGVDINVPKTIHDTEYPNEVYGVETFHVNAGWQHFSGVNALKYARTRHADSDYGRQRRQQDLLRAMLDKVRNAQMWPTLLTKLPTLIYTLRNSIETNLPIPTMLAYANYVSKTDLQGIQQESVDGKYGEPGENSLGQWILRPDRAKVRVAVNRYFDALDLLPSSQASTIENQGGTAAIGDVIGDVSWVRIEVLNGTSTRNVAARTSELLRAQGWNVISTTDADRNDYAQTTVVNYGVSEAILQKISRDLALSQPQFSNSSGLTTGKPVEVKIVVGTDLLPKLGMSASP